MRREELLDLNAFVTVAEERSFTRAAAKLGTSQSALSYAIRGLETRLGVRHEIDRLFDCLWCVGPDDRFWPNPPVLGMSAFEVWRLGRLTEQGVRVVTDTVSQRDQRPMSPDTPDRVNRAGESEAVAVTMVPEEMA